MSRTVCLIGPGHIASNPRLVKEADALHEAGYQVKVISGTSHPKIDVLDEKLIASRPWKVTRVRLGSKWRRAPDVLRQKISRSLIAKGIGGLSTSVWAESPITGRLLKAALNVSADLYIGHYLPGLYAASLAAKKHNAIYGFDIEDSHVDELEDVPENSWHRNSRRKIESTLLKNCRHLTASSPLIANQYRDRYGVESKTILNVFPVENREIKPDRTDYLNGLGGPRLYWFSQTIGAGRGLEPIVEAMSLMKIKPRLYLRGLPSSGYQDRLNALARSKGLDNAIEWLPPGDPDDMVSLSKPYDLGLGLELCTPPNRAICLTNKAFTYISAGLPVVLSHTPAQDWLAEQLGDAATLVDLSKPDRIAEILDDVLCEHTALLIRRFDAKQKALKRFCWELEKRAFLASVESAFSK